MAYTTIISAAELAGLIAGDAPPLVFDCEFDLFDDAKGREVYLQGHIPGAHYVDTHGDLAGHPDGSNGRHPLPDREAFAARMRELGLSAGRQVIAYDGNGGHFAARLWWMLRWIGHEAVAVLDGGKTGWVAEGFALEAGVPVAAPAGDFVIGPALVGGVKNAADVLANLDQGDLLVIDARGADRFRGEPNPLDTASGHIPGARNRFVRDNFDASGKYKSAEALAAEWNAVLDGTLPANAVMQCGSGITACSNALALEIAGLKGALLYPGSWSEWTADPSRPIEKD